MILFCWEKCRKWNSFYSDWFVIFLFGFEDFSCLIDDLFLGLILVIYRGRIAKSAISKLTIHLRRIYLCVVEIYQCRIGYLRRIIGDFDCFTMSCIPDGYSLVCSICK